MKNSILKVVVIGLLAALAVAPLWAKGSGEAAATEKVTLRMFTTDAGVPVPNGVDPNDNWLINIVEKYANVDLILEIPAYQDLTTKLRLLLASQNLPDIVRGTSKTDMDKAADDGAFVDLAKYYDKSAVMQKRVAKPLTDMARSPKGLLYGMPSVNTQALGDLVNVIRLDFLEKYGKKPGTVEEWIDFVRWYHKNYPNAIPMTTRISTDNIWWTGEVFFLWYGVRPYNFSIRNGHVVRDFTLPEIKEPLSLFRQVYAEGLYDKEFMSNQAAVWVSKLYGKDVVLWSYMNYQVALNGYIFNTNFAPRGGTPGFFTVADQLTTYPASVKDKRYTYPYLERPIYDHRISIAAQSKNPDRAWKAIEGFVTDEFIDAIYWGREGIHHTVVNGKKVPVLDKIYKRDQNDPNSHNWTAGQALIISFEFNEAQVALQEQQLGKDQYGKILSSTMWPRTAAKERGTYFAQFVPSIEGVSEKLTESNAFISQATMEVVTGAITIEQFAAKQEEFQKKYGFITDAYEKWVQANKDKLRANGVKEIDW